MRARLVAAGLIHGPGGGDTPAADVGEPTSARVAVARSRADERLDRQRQTLLPLGWVLIAVVVVAGVESHPAPGLQGAHLGISLALAGYAAATAAAIFPPWARRGLAVQASVIVLMGGCGVVLAALQQHGPGQLAASAGVWIAAVRLATPLAIAAAGAITGALAVAIGLTQHSVAQSVVFATLLCALLAVTGQFIRRGRESQDRTEVLMAQLQDARDAEAAAAALAERSRIAGELHDVLAHSLSGLAIQLQGARKLAERESATADLRAAIERSAELTKAGLTDARQAVGALRGDRLPTLDQLGALVEDFRRDTGADATLHIDGTRRPLPADASLALYRGAQEALTNIVRYAPGAAVSVTVCYQAERTLLTVEDHARCLGDGAARSSAPVLGDAPVVGDAPVLAGAPVLADAGGGHGLTAMRERAERAGGTARAGPTADGWLVELEVPA